MFYVKNKNIIFNKQCLNIGNSGVIDGVYLVINACESEGCKYFNGYGKWEILNGTKFISLKFNSNSFLNIPYFSGLKVIYKSV